MEEKDLRIGNYVYWKNVTEPYTHFLIEEINDLKYINCFEPIPLNKEWFEKFGFKYNNPTYEWYDKNAVFFIQVNYLGFDLIAKFHNQVIKEIKHVHELQNLYFALTGKELAKV